MIKHLRICGAVVLVAGLAACAETPLRTGYGGSQPVYAGAAGGAYPPPAPVYNNAGNANGNPPPVYASADGSAWGTVERVEDLGGGARRDTGLGAVIGAGIGAIAGNQIGRNINDAKTTGTVVGAIGGGVIGNAIERNQNANNRMLRVYVRLDDGSERYWDVSAAQISPAVGQRLRVQNDQLFAQ